MIRHLPHHPLRHLVLLPRALRPELPGFFREVHENRTGFEYRDGAAAAQRFMIDDGGHAMVGIDRQIFPRELIALADVQWNEAVRNSRFLQKDGYFLTVRRGPEK